MYTVFKEEIEIIQENIDPRDWKFIDTTKPYTKWLYGIDCTEYDVITSIGVRNTDNGSKVLLFAAGGASGVHDTAYILDQDSIIICVSDSVFSLNRIDLTKKWITKCDPATCFEVIQCDDNYLIHGELSISLINRYGEILWTFSGRDIFVSPDSEETVIIIDDEIHLMDWEGYKYVLNKNGVLIR